MHLTATYVTLGERADSKAACPGSAGQALRMRTSDEPGSTISGNVGWGCWSVNFPKSN